MTELDQINVELPIDFKYETLSKDLLEQELARLAIKGEDDEVR